MITTNSPGSLNFSNQDFTTFDESTKKSLYQKANETHNVELVRQLNDCGMKPQAENLRELSLISPFMDIATKEDIIKKFLIELRQTNRLLTEKEFQSLSHKKWIDKGSKLTRILGSDYIAQKAMENNLKHIKVPYKIAVIEEGKLSLNGWYYVKNLYDFNSAQIKVYAEKIKSVERHFSRKEIDEFIQIIALTRFSDLGPSNIVVAKDGIYFIDTEFKSFGNILDWGKIGRFETLIADEDKEYFLQEVQKKFDEPDVTEEETEYLSLKNNLRSIDEAIKFFYPSLQNEKDGKLTLDELLEANLHRKFVVDQITRLEYVGAKKVGTNWVNPNKFSFDSEDILSKVSHVH